MCSLGKTLLALPCFFLYSKAKFSCYSRYLLTFYLCVPGIKQNLVRTRTQKKGAATPQETEPDLLVSVQASPWRYGSTVACCEVKGTEHKSPGSHRVCWPESFERGHHYHHHPKLQDGNTAALINRKFDLRFTEHGPAYENKTQIPPSQSLPSESFHKPLILIHQRTERMKTTITKN